jgi:CubicO group peptidase (beta-lactamase class C family)
VTRLVHAERVLAEAIARRVFPGAVVDVGSVDGSIATVACGTLAYDRDSGPVAGDTVYDLASLTKVLGGAPLAADLVSRGALGLEDRLRAWVPGWTTADRHDATVRHLLEHASGLPAHRRYYESISGRAAFETAICAEPLAAPPGSASLYSDAGFILLGLFVERAGGAPLDELFSAWRTANLGRACGMRYLPPPERTGRTAPTEADPWRGRLLHGEVHDENAAALGGVAAHAGLFGTASDVAAAARWWMATTPGSPVLQEFVRRGRVPGSSRALGWDTMLPTSSCGTRMSARAFGHTGFTGTSLWIDPEGDYYVVFLSNRVHPSRADGEAIALVRRTLHDAVAEDLARR